jgi:hypothetical protein
LAAQTNPTRKRGRAAFALAYQQISLNDATSCLQLT